MAIQFAIETPGPVAGKPRMDLSQHVRKPSARLALRHAIVPLRVGAGDPAVAVCGPERLLPIASRDRARTQYALVDSLVTFAVLSGFAAALAAMAGEIHGGPSLSATAAAQVEAVIPVSPHVASSEGAALPVDRLSIQAQMGRNT